MKETIGKLWIERKRSRDRTVSFSLRGNFYKRQPYILLTGTKHKEPSTRNQAPGIKHRRPSTWNQARGTKNPEAAWYRRCCKTHHERGPNVIMNNITEGTRNNCTLVELNRANKRENTKWRTRNPRILQSFKCQTAVQNWCKYKQCI